MRSLLIVAILVGVAVANPFGNLIPIKPTLETHSTLNCIENRLTGLVTGNMESNIEDPLVISEIAINLDFLHGRISLGEVVFENVILSGITNVQKSYTTKYDRQSRAFVVNAELTWPLLSIAGSYQANITTENLEIDGNGEINANVTNIIVSGSAEVTPAGAVKIIEVKPSVGEIQFEIDGLYVNGEDRSDLVNELVTTAAGELLENAEEIDVVIKQVVAKVVNSSGVVKSFTSSLGLAAVSKIALDCYKA